MALGSCSDFIDGVSKAVHGFGGVSLTLLIHSSPDVTVGELRDSKLVAFGTRCRWHVRIECQRHVSLVVTPTTRNQKQTMR